MVYNYEAKRSALAAFLKVSPDEITSWWPNGTHRRFEYARKEFLVLTNEEANEEAARAIMERLWAFNADFLFDFLGVRNPVARNAHEKMMGNICESGNEIVELMIGARMPEFIRTVIASDGRGEFLAPYDSYEWEQDGFYVYRVE